MSKEFKDTFNEMAIERLSEICDTVIVKNKKCIFLSEQRHEIYKKICEQVSPDVQKLIREYEDIFNHRAARTEEILYKQGFKDGLQMAMLSKEAEE